jgi:hypothetical protein
LCGFADFEDEVVQVIKENNSICKQLQDKCDELKREIADHKVQVEQITSKRDVGF